MSCSAAFNFLFSCAEAPHRRSDGKRRPGTLPHCPLPKADGERKELRQYRNTATQQHNFNCCGSLRSPQPMQLLSIPIYVRHCGRNGCHTDRPTADERFHATP